MYSFLPDPAAPAVACRFKHVGPDHAQADPKIEDAVGRRGRDQGRRAEFRVCGTKVKKKAYGGDEL